MRRVPLGQQGDSFVAVSGGGGLAAAAAAAV